MPRKFAAAILDCVTCHKRFAVWRDYQKRYGNIPINQIQCTECKRKKGKA